MSNITFFGASVTQQKTGFTYEFQKLTNHNINIFGYGSMHLYDAGICFLDDVIQSKPEYCFIDWFGTSYVNNNINEYLDAITYKLNEINCTIIYLFLDRLDMNNNRIEMYQASKKYADEHNIFYIDLYNIVSINELLKDVVHTNDSGSKHYATYIYNEFINRIFNNKMPKVIVSKNKYCDIKILDYTNTIYDKLIINGYGTIIGIYQTIGPFSGLIRINNKQMINLWDQWCHFERNNIKINITVDNFSTIEVINDTFDTSSCKVTSDWIYPKYIKIIKIFYIGSIIIE